MSCMKNCCKSFLVLLNAFLLLCGLAITGISIYLIVEQYQNNVFGDSTGALWMVWTPFVLGIVVCIMSLLHCCCAALGENKCLLFTFGFLHFIFGLIILLAGVFLLVYTGYQEDISQTSDLSTLSPGAGDTRRILSDFNLGTFNKCCENGQSNAYNRCGSGACWFDNEKYMLGYDVSSETCTTIMTTLNLCPNPSTIQGYNQKLYNYFNDVFYPGGIAFIVFGCLLLLASFGSCYICCSGNDDDKNSSTPTKSSQSGAQTAGTGAPVSQV